MGLFWDFGEPFSVILLMKSEAKIGTHFEQLPGGSLGLSWNVVWLSRASLGRRGVRNPCKKHTQIAFATKTCFLLSYLTWCASGSCLAGFGAISDPKRGPKIPIEI